MSFTSLNLTKSAFSLILHLCFGKYIFYLARLCCIGLIIMGLIIFKYIAEDNKTVNAVEMKLGFLHKFFSITWFQYNSLVILFSYINFDMFPNATLPLLAIPYLILASSFKVPVKTSFYISYSRSTTSFL